MKIMIALLSLSLITFSFDLSSAEPKAKPKAKPSTSRKARTPAEQRLNGILRSTDKDHDPKEPFHTARSPAEKSLDEIISRTIKDNNIFEYVLGRPWYDAKKDSGYSRLFTKKLVGAITKQESDLVKETCGGKYGDDICGIDYNPITCAQDYSDSGYLYRTVEDDGYKAIILSPGVVYASNEAKTTYRLIKVGDDWKLDGVVCGGGGEFNMDCSVSVCEEDVLYFRQKADAGDSNAQFSLGVMYNTGRGGLWDKAKAVFWFRKAADQGHADAQSYLGHIYEYGLVEDAPKDYGEAAKWYLKAAEQSEVHAQFSLGEMYELGQGVQQDIAEALKWYRKAANLGLSRARYRLGLMYELGQGVQQDDAEAVTWIRQAAERNYSDAQYHLGVIYKNGRSVKIDFSEAEKWFRKAADRGHQGAKPELENLGRR
jgi:TPR repeat protein